MSVCKWALFISDFSWREENMTWKDHERPNRTTYQNYSRSPTSPSVGTCRDKASTIKKERVISLFLFSTSRTIEQPSSSRVTSSSMKKITLISRQGNDEKHDGISFLSCIWMRTTNKKVARNVPLSCFHWHISCRFWSFDDITETPGSAWAITESDSSFPLCSLKLFLDKIRIKKYWIRKKRSITHG